MKQYKQYIFAAFIIFLVFCQVACQDKDNQENENGYGYIQISSVELDKTVIPRSTKSTDKFALDILKDGDVIKHVDDWTSMQSESIELPAGKYVLQAYSSDKQLAQGLDAQPYYLGENIVTVEKNKAKSVEVVCTLSQSMVSVNYSANFKKAFTSYESKVTNENGTVTFSSTETRPAYFISGKALDVVLDLTNTDGKSFTTSKQITEKAEKRYHYKLNYDVTNEGTGSFTFTIDETIREYEFNITVPVKGELTEDSRLHTKDANAWGQFAYLYGSFDDQGNTDPITFMYKETIATEWIIVDAILANDTYMAKTEKLDFSKSYDYRISCGNKVGDIKTFTTESFEEIPNLNFDTWTQKGKTWYANPVANNYDAVGAYWATGNEGVTSFLAGSKDPITIPVEGDDAYKGKAARLRTITGVTLVKSAAGNLLIGKYKTNMGNPSQSVIFGRPYSGARPVTLSGYYKYDPKPINEGSKPGNLTTDECHVYMRLWDASGNEIGYGEFVGKEAVSTYTKFSFDIVYTDIITKPASITIVATSSHYGGDFNGIAVIGQVGAGSTLWVDEFELSYYK